MTDSSKIHDSGMVGQQDNKIAAGMGQQNTMKKHRSKTAAPLLMPWGLHLRQQGE
jgi:hypothetical protein